jgi:DNA repair protein RadC
MTTLHTTDTNGSYREATHDEVLDAARQQLARRIRRGTIDGASVHPREVVKAALIHNAAAVILAHNHPSGVAEPSHADELITNRLRDALALIDVRILDHLITSRRRDPELRGKGAPLAP